MTGKAPAGQNPTTLRWYRRLVAAALGYSFLVLLLSIGSLVVLLNQP